MCSAQCSVELLYLCFDRSPGAAPRAFSFISSAGLLVVKDGVQSVGKRGEIAAAGQVAAAIDTTNGGEWSVRLLSGTAAGLDLSMPRHHLESYNGETSLCSSYGYLMC